MPINASEILLCLQMLFDSESNRNYHSNIALLSPVGFVPYIDRLFDENVLIGTGWTTYESLRLVS